MEMAARLAQGGLKAIGGHDDAKSQLVRSQALRLGLVDDSGAPVVARTAELLVVVSLNVELADVPPTPVSERRLFFTEPSGRVDDRDRIDLYVSEVIRQSNTELRIGSRFWNKAGIEYLQPVLEPAILVRGVETTVYAHGDNRAETNQLFQLLAGEDPPNLTVLWYSGPPNSLMHAKFVVADRSRGYLGTANLTSLGMQRHIEIGVELSTQQASQLVGFLDQLTEEGAFAEDKDCRSLTSRTQ
jgi:hypothetical protein